MLLSLLAYVVYIPTLQGMPGRYKVMRTLCDRLQWCHAYLAVFTEDQLCPAAFAASDEACVHALQADIITLIRALDKIEI